MEHLPTTHFACQMIGNSQIQSTEFFLVYRQSTLNMPRLLTKGAKQPWGDESEDGKTWLNRHFSPQFVDFVDAFSNFAISLRFDQMPASSVVRVLQNSFWSDRPHVPKVVVRE